MSTLIVDPGKFNPLVNSISSQNMLFLNSDFLYGDSLGTPDKNRVRQIVAALFDANVKSYNSRYNTRFLFIDNEAEKTKTLNIYETVKTLQCLLYNIDQVFIEYRLIKDTEKLIDELVYIHFMNSDDYQDASWG